MCAAYTKTLASFSSACGLRLVAAVWIGGYDVQNTCALPIEKAQAVKRRLANARLEPPMSRMRLSNVTWQGPLIAGKRQLARCRETRPSVIISNHRVRPYSSGGSSSKYRRLGKAWLSMLAGPCLITGCGAATDYSDPPWAWLTE